MVFIRSVAFLFFSFAFQLWRAALTSRTLAPYLEHYFRLYALGGHIGRTKVLNLEKFLLHVSQKKAMQKNGFAGTFKTDKKQVQTAGRIAWEILR